MSLTIGTEYNAYTYEAKGTSGTNNKSNNVSIYDQQILDEYEAEMAAKRQKNIDAGEAAIEKANAYGYDEFSLSMQADQNGKKTGMVAIVLNEDITFMDIALKLGIPKGKIYEYNKAILDKLGTKTIGYTGIKTHDTVEAPKGTKLVIPGGFLNPQKPIGQKLSDWWNNLTK